MTEHRARRYGAGDAGQISERPPFGLVQFEIEGDEAEGRHEDPAGAGRRRRRAGTRTADFTVEEFGAASANYELNDTFDSDFKRAEFSSLPVTLVILLVAFGALVAAGLPVLLAFSGVLATIGLSSLASHVVAAGDATQSVILLVGMAVGVDYSLFYLRREREERAVAPATATALLTRGRDVRPGGPHLRPDGADRDGRNALRRQRDLHLDRHRHDDRGRASP